MFSWLKKKDKKREEILKQTAEFIDFLDLQKVKIEAIQQHERDIASGAFAKVGNSDVAVKTEGEQINVTHRRAHKGM